MKQSINSITMQELQDATSPTYLRHEERTRALRDPVLLRCFANTIIMRVPSSKFDENSTYWHQYIMLEDLKGLVKRNGWSLEEAVRYCIEEGNVHLYCDCIVPGTKILTDHGCLNIEDIKPGMKVYTHKGRFKTVLAVSSREDKKEFYSVKFRGQIEPLVLSKDHPLLVSSIVEAPSWKLPGELSPRTPNLKTTSATLLPVISGGNSYDLGLARLIGYYAAEGSLVSYQTKSGKEKYSSVVKITLNINEEDTVGADILSICKSLGLKVRVSETVLDKQSWVDYRIYSLKLVHICLKLIGRYSKSKFLSSEIFSWSSEARMSFLAGFALGDGWKEPKKGIRLLSTSLSLITGLECLVAGLGMNAFASYRDKHSSLSSDGIQRSPVYQVTISENCCFPLYEVMLPLLRNKDLMSIGTSGHSKPYIRDGYFYRYLESVTPVEYNGICYDLTVEDDESFVANGIVVHNCPAHLYWAYKYYATRGGYSYGGYKENRAPTRNNVNADSLLCKHTDKAFRYLQSHIDEVITWFKEYYNVSLKKAPEEPASAVNEKPSDIPDKPRYTSKSANKTDVEVAYEDETTDTVFIPTEQEREEINQIAQEEAEEDQFQEDRAELEAEEDPLPDEVEDESIIEDVDDSEEDGLV